MALTPDTVKKQLNIGKTQYYQYLKDLGITATKVNGKAALTEEDYERLRSHIEKVRAAAPGKSNTSPETTPNAPPDEKEVKNALATVDDSGEIETSTPVVDLNDNESVKAFIRRAQELKASELVQADLVLAQLASQMTFEDLDPDLQAQVEQQRREAATPFAPPAAIAHRLLSQHRSGKQK